MPEKYFIAVCALFVLVPYLVLSLRIRVARSNNDRNTVTVGNADDHRDHILVYLFALMLPFYSEDIGTWRDFGATVGALALIVFIFFHLNLHYMNVVFAAKGYRVFTVTPPQSKNELSGAEPVVVITKRSALTPGDVLTPVRISSTVYIEDE